MHWQKGSRWWKLHASISFKSDRNQGQEKSKTNYYTTKIKPLTLWMISAEWIYCGVKNRDVSMVQWTFLQLFTISLSGWQEGLGGLFSELHQPSILWESGRLWTGRGRQSASDTWWCYWGRLPSGGSQSTCGKKRVFLLKDLEIKEQTMKWEMGRADLKWRWSDC